MILHPKGKPLKLGQIKKEVKSVTDMGWLKTVNKIQ